MSTSKPASPQVSAKQDAARIEHSERLKKIAALLESGQPQAALDLVNSRNSSDPSLKNARAVCLMRLGNPDQAVRVLREITLANGGVWFRDNIPLEYKVNFATALAMTGNASGAASILNELPTENSPSVARLQDAIQRWKQSLSLWQRFLWKLGIASEQPVPLDFPPGEIV